MDDFHNDLHPMSRKRKADADDCSCQQRPVVQDGPSGMSSSDPTPVSDPMLLPPAATPRFRPTSSRRKRDLADNYWNAIVRELESGCTCATVDAHGRLLKGLCVCATVPIPIGRPFVLPSSTFTTVRTPSRLKPLLTELLEVLISIIQPVVARSPSLSLHPGLLHPQYNQNASHVAMLRSILDADLIQQEIDHRLFDPCGVFQTIGDIIRCYCAPMRDHAVDQMVKLAHSCSPGGTGTKADAVRAIRLCFEIMELMKLDVANHQLQTLRPYLVHSAAQFELKTFQESRQKGQLSLSVTRQWLKTAHAELADENVRPEGIPVSPAASFLRSLNKPSRHVQIQVAVTKAFVNLIFEPPSSSSASPSASPASRSSPAAAVGTNYPETLYLDHARLNTFSTDAADFTALYMLMMLHRQLLQSGAPLKTDSVLKTDELLILKKEIWEIGPQHFGLCFRKDADDEREWDKWRDDISNAVLHLTVHASETRSSRSSSASSIATPTSSDSSESLARRVPDANLLTLATNWVHSNLRHDSPLSQLMRKRLRNKVEEVALGLVLPSIKKPSSSESPTSLSASTSGLEPLMPEITHLAERLVKLVGIHTNVYGALYMQPGFVFP
ncbi:hypothetical protein EUX98_g2713 [Antrodiella citrinella]|uniref:Tcp11-domain-containing protein n=1 Tax=Antrodiella citrinella TaxID=2447956 RepID=A0A4S4N176_9APHY|nr:hypothetical protein EUX98_g2713 [Antrodiella citrinella]